MNSHSPNSAKELNYKTQTEHPTFYYVRSYC